MPILIDADALEKEVRESMMENKHKNPDVRRNHNNEHVHFLHMICLAPTIDPESLRPHGEWVVCGDGENVPWMCSHCGKTTAHKYKVMYGKYCPNCGAKMDEEELVNDQD